MTEDERKLLSDLADKIASTPSPAKDPEAEQFIRTHIGSRPDALYLMTQTVIIQNIALQQAQAQIQQLQGSGGQSGQLSSGGSFIGQGQQQAPPPPPPRQGYAYAPPPPSYAAPSPALPNPAPGGGTGGFLRGAAQTAAGVAAGALAFEGIESLFHGGGLFGGGGGMFGGGAGIGGYAPRMEETVVNNYYDNGPQGGGNYDDRGAFADQGGGRDDYQAADDAANQGYDDSANQVDDNAGVDDGGGFDDSASDNSGGGDNFS